MFLLNLLSSLPNFPSNIYLLGDFNHNLISFVPGPLSSLIDYLALNQIIHSPTRFSSAGVPAILDLALIPNSVSSTYSVFPPHCFLCLFVSHIFNWHSPLILPPISATPKPIFLFHKADFPSRNDALSSIPWSSILDSNPDTCSSFFVSKLNQLT